MGERYSTPCVDCGRPTKAHRCGECRAKREVSRYLELATGKYARRIARQRKAQR